MLCSLREIAGENMYEIGRICVKIAGRDAGQTCVVVDVLDDTYVVVDGQTRRKKCNVKHLEPLNKTISIGKNASNAEVISALKSEGIECQAKKVSAQSQSSPRPKKQKPVKASVKPTADKKDKEPKIKAAKKKVSEQ
jgi:large subunit ribosomal protein L14e